VRKILSRSCEANRIAYSSCEIRFAVANILATLETRKLFCYFEDAELVITETITRCTAPGLLKLIVKREFCQSFACLFNQFLCLSVNTRQIRVNAIICGVKIDWSTFQSFRSPLENPHQTENLLALCVPQFVQGILLSAFMAAKYPRK
jgi:hypothetical protein